MRWELVLEEATGERRELLSSSPLSIGRSAESQLRIEDISVSAEQAKLELRTDGRWQLTDVGSTNGSWLGEARLKPHAPRLVVADARVKFGTVVGRFLARIDEVDSVDGAHVAVAVLDAMAKANERGTVVYVVDGGTEAPSASIGVGDVIRLSRGLDSTLPLAAESVSVSHAEVRRTEEGIFVRDVGSRHGTELGGRRLPKDEWTVWEPGTCLVLGKAIALMFERERSVDDVNLSRIVPVNLACAAAAEVLEDVAAVSPVAPEPPRSSKTLGVVGAPIVALPAAPAAAQQVQSWAPAWAPYALGVLVFLVTVGTLVWLLRG